MRDKYKEKYRKLSAQNMKKVHKIHKIILNQVTRRHLSKKSLLGCIRNQQFVTRNIRKAARQGVDYISKKQEGESKNRICKQRWEWSTLEENKTTHSSPNLKESSLKIWIKWIQSLKGIGKQKEGEQDQSIMCFSYAQMQKRIFKKPTRWRSTDAFSLS